MTKKSVSVYDHYFWAALRDGKAKSFTVPKAKKPFVGDILLIRNREHGSYGAFECVVTYVEQPGPNGLKPTHVSISIGEIKCP